MSVNPSQVVAQLMAEGRQGSPDGYTPWKVLETMRNSALFRVWFNALPDDLTDIDLSPLYLLTETAEESRELSLRAREWRPDPLNLSDAYNGPIGPEGEADRWIVSRWREAVEDAHRKRVGRFSSYLNVMAEGQIPKRLRDAVTALVELALTETPEDEISEWDDCSSALDVVATSAALRLCVVTLCEIEATAKGVAEQTAKELKRDLARIEQLAGGEA
ncbi:hypothetical protein IAD21_00550 [Abditibacteriota bacterium]|nr:hypothetical protein IAD21_00550 [Abditibacteriota bacterium]